MRKFAKVEGSQTLVRDLNTGAILNTDKSTLDKAREAKALRQKKNQEFDELKGEVKEMKEMLTKLIEKL
jgi:hypothetical protein